jgi:predicted nucleic acid-binding protein
MGPLPCPGIEKKSRLTSGIPCHEIILVEAKHLGLLSNVQQALEGMRNVGYWIHDDIVKTALEQAREK